MCQETVDVDRESLLTLTQESLEKSKSIQKLEESAVDLYKALQTGRDRGLWEFQYGFVLDNKFSHDLVSRHGCRDGTTFRIQDVQFTVLQTNFRLPVDYVYCTGILSTNGVNERI
jgi:hypothetical protein